MLLIGSAVGAPLPNAVRQLIALDTEVIGQGLGRGPGLTSVEAGPSSRRHTGLMYGSLLAEGDPGGAIRSDEILLAIEPSYQGQVINAKAIGQGAGVGLAFVGLQAAPGNDHSLDGTIAFASATTATRNAALEVA